MQREQRYLLAVRHVPVILIPVLLGAGCGAPENESVLTVGERTTMVRVVAVSEEEVTRATTQPATVHPFYRAEVLSRASGYVTEIRHDIGELVSKGDVLAVLDVPELQRRRDTLLAEHEQCLAQESRVDAEIKLAAARVETAQAKLAQAGSELGAVEASLAAVESEFKRIATLVERKSIEARLLDEVRKKRDSERSALEAKQAAVRSDETAVEVARAMETAAQADLKIAQSGTAVVQARIDEVDVEIGYASIKAPLSGLVTRRTIDEGDLVSAGLQNADGTTRHKPLFVISQMDLVRVRIPVPETEAVFISRGDAVRLTFPAFRSEPARESIVRRISGDLDEDARMMIVEAQLDNSDGRLLPGMFGEATITANQQVAGSMLPARAIRFDDEGQPFVYRLNADETVSVVPVVTGRDDGHRIEIRSGLQPRERVIDAHLQRFREGQKVLLIAEGT